MLAVKSIGLVLLVALLEIASCQRQSTCANTFCPRGRRCIEVSGGVGTLCDCPVQCSDDYDPVCSVYGIEFRNRCQLHMFACEKMNINIAVHNQGPCDPAAFSDPSIRRCYRDTLIQFPHRYLDWILIANKRQGLNPKFTPVIKVRGNELGENEVKDVLEWEFKIIDSNNNGKLDANEAIQVERDLLSVDEGCVRGFLKSCDLNKNGVISLGEWFRCFPDGRRA